MSSVQRRVVLAASAITTLAAFLVVSSAASKSKFSDYDSQAKKLLAQMTLDEKIGQMTEPDSAALASPSEVTTYSFGSVLSGGSSDPKAGNSLRAWTDMYDGYQKAALASRLHIPILYGIDALHGHNNVLGAVIFPHNIGLGCTRDAALVEKIARVTADEVRATGIQWAFAPCVTVPQDIRWGRSYEGFSQDTALVTELGQAALRGLQGNLNDPRSVLACSKHYIGDGGTTFGTGGPNGKTLDQGDMRVDEATIRRLYLPPYVATVKDGVGTIMPSYNTWNGVRCSASKRLLTDILKDELGFQGFLISDYNAINEIRPDDFKTSIEISINAGMDMAMVAEHAKPFMTDLKQLIEEHRVPMERIDDAVTRILRVKYAMGLMDKHRSQLADRKLWKDFGSPAHRDVARQAVRESLVLLKDDHKTLPASKTMARIHVAGSNADNIGNQCGGWTIDWQGRTGDVTTGGTTILKAIRNTVSNNTKVTYSLDGTGAAGANLGILVIGEKPYAEGAGDRTDLHLSPEDIAAFNNMKQAGIPVAVVLISGRPMILDDMLDRSDAFIAAWLPGTEGQGVADVLFGAYKPTGKLSFYWPRTMADIPIRPDDPSWKPLFKIGYGLSYE